jgi:plastocyanin
MGVSQNDFLPQEEKNMKNFQSFGLAVTLALSMVSGIAGKAARASGAESKPAEVSIDNFSFSSKTLTVSAGTTVTWTNKDDVPHTVTSTDKVFASPVLDTDEKFSYTFTKPGEYAYYCTLHPKMTAKVVVQ